jgi:hypothetical protein
MWPVYFYNRVIDYFFSSSLSFFLIDKANVDSQPEIIMIVKWPHSGFAMVKPAL